MYKELLKTLISVIAFTIVIAGCSRDSSNPIITTDPALDLPSTDYITEGENHESLGFYIAKFDLDSMTATVEPNREMSLRLNVKPYLPNPIITINSWDPVEQLIDVDVKITNPYNIHGFDLRLIIFTDNIGHTLINDDGWTSLYDIPGGWPINPFKAYAKDASYRIFGAYSQRTENLIIKLPGMNPNVSFAIDVSSPLNSPEPYQIADFGQTVLPEEINETAIVFFTVSRWNPTSSVSAWIRCTDIFGANIIQIPTSDNYYFEGTITNYTGAPQGKYLATILTKSNLSPLYLYDVVTISVAEFTGSGWAAQIDDSMVTTVAADLEGNVYCAGLDAHDLMKYDDASTQVWSRNIGTEEYFHKVNDLHFNDFLRVTGTYTLCTTNYIGYNAAMYGPDNTNYFAANDCMESLGGGVGVSVLGDDYGFTYISSSYGNVYWTSIGMYMYSDSLMTKFDADGDIVWNKQFTADPANIAFVDLVFGNPEQIAATGYFLSSIIGGSVDFDPDSGEQLKYPQGSADSFLAQYNASDGSFEKVITWGSDSPSTTNMVLALALDTDKNHNYYVSGFFQGTIDFDPGTNVVTKTNISPLGNLFLSKFDPNWNFINVVQLPPPSQSANFLNWGSMTCDRFGNVYYAGTFEGTIDFDPGDGVTEITSVGGMDMFLLKLNPSLNFQWVRTWGSAGNETGFDVACNKDNGNIYLVGTFEDTIDFDPGPNVYNLTPVISPDSVLMKILPNGYW